MARLAKPVDKWHRVTIKGRGKDELILMGRGRGMQLSVWTDSHPGNFAYFCGQKALRTLAKAILATPQTKRS